MTVAKFCGMSNVSGSAWLETATRQRHRTRHAPVLSVFYTLEHQTVVLLRLTDEAEGHVYTTYARCDDYWASRFACGSRKRSAVSSTWWAAWLKLRTTSPS
jgi:hypothetical protein